MAFRPPNQEYHRHSTEDAGGGVGTLQEKLSVESEATSRTSLTEAQFVAPFMAFDSIDGDTTVNGVRVGIEQPMSFRANYDSLAQRMLVQHSGDGQIRTGDLSTIHQENTILAREVQLGNGEAQSQLRFDTKDSEGRPIFALLTLKLDQQENVSHATLFHRSSEGEVDIDFDGSTLRASGVDRDTPISEVLYQKVQALISIANPEYLEAYEQFMASQVHDRKEKVQIVDERQRVGRFGIAALRAHLPHGRLHRHGLLGAVLHQHTDR